MGIDNPIEVISQDEGVEVSRRPKANFIGAGVTVTDDVPNKRVKVEVPGYSDGEADTRIALHAAVADAHHAKYTDAEAVAAVEADNLGIRYMQMVVFDWTTDVATGDGKFYAHVLPAFNGMNLVYCHAEVITAGTTNTLDIQIHNLTQTADMLSTLLTVDSGETGSDEADVPYVIDTGNDDVATNDVLRVDVDAVHTTAAKGLIVTLGFQLP